MELADVAFDLRHVRREVHVDILVLLHLPDQTRRQAGDVRVFQRVMNVVQMPAQPLRSAPPDGP